MLNSLSKLDLPSQMTQVTNASSPRLLRVAIHLQKSPDQRRTRGGLIAFASGVPHAAPFVEKPATPAATPVVPEVTTDQFQPVPLNDKPADHESSDGFTQEMVGVAERVEQATHDRMPKHDVHMIQVIRQDDIQPSFVTLHSQTTIGSLAVAEAKIGSLVPPICMNTSVGTRYLSAAVTKPFDQVFLKEMAQYGSQHAVIMPPELKSSQSMTRIALLYRQEAYVGEDEMAFYLRMLTATGQVTQAPLVIIPPHYEDDELVLHLRDWYARALLVADSPSIVVSAMFAHNHWFPIGMRFQHGMVDLFTSYGGYEWLQIITQDQPTTCTLHKVGMPQEFQNDCGFQCVGWIMSLAFDPQHHQDRLRAVSADTAIAWRSLFEHHLHVSGQAQKLVVPSQIAFGGVGGSDPSSTLMKLLEEHGVPSNAVEERSHVIMDKIGRSAITKAFRGTQPWKEIKQLANQCSPKLQLVLPSELQEVIRARTQDQQQFGSKQTKKKGVTTTRPPIQVGVDDISIPKGIFQDADGNEVLQRPITSIGPDASGIIVAKALQAVPYLRFAQPVSQKGLALLILDHQDPMLHGVGEEVRFPARYEKTSEPILLSAKLVQLGNILVSRVVPDHALQIEEVQTTVIRFVMYRDEIDKGWETVIAKPVRFLVSTVPALQLRPDGTSPIMDVWDRQYLNNKLEKTRPTDATMFMTCIRLETADITETLKASGNHGVYAEPRSHDGRTPSSEYRVIWLNKQDKQNVLLASQSTKQWTCIVRSGDRFGLRTHSQDAKQVHEIHKPQTPFLASDQVMIFQVGPLPHGATRTTINKLFTSWNWQARPCQPKSRTPDGKGIVWECHAVSKPPFEVYQMQHSDVLITQIERRSSKPTQNQQHIQASAKTIAALRANESQKEPTEDPWQQDDPWGNYQTPVKSSRTTLPSRDSHDRNIDVIATKVQQKLQPAWNQKIHRDTDQDMHAEDTRIQVMEDRLNKLEQTVQANHAQQGQHAQELAAQINKVQQNVDQQGRAFQAHLDEKLDNQLHQIEQLLPREAALNDRKGGLLPVRS